MTAPTATEIANAFAGLRAPVSQRFRYEWKNQFNATLADISEAFDSRRCSVELQNDRATLRTAKFAIRPTLMPSTFNYLEDFVGVFADVLVPGIGWYREQLGLFRMDEPENVFRAGPNDTVVAAAADLSTVIIQANYGTPYTILEGTNYVTAIEDILDDTGLNHSLPATSYVTPVDFTFPSKMPRLTIVNKLLLGINYQNIWANKLGVMVSEARVAPSTVAAAVAYRTNQEPRMMRPPFQRRRSAVQPKNTIVYTIDDPLRPPAAGVAQNVDGGSSSSVLVVEVNLEERTADRIVSSAVASDIAAYDLRIETGRGETATLITHPDFRRDAHEVYTIRYFDTEVETKWRVSGWALPLYAGAPMTHTLERAAALSVSQAVVIP